MKPWMILLAAMANAAIAAEPAPQAAPLETWAPQGSRTRAASEPLGDDDLRRIEALVVANPKSKADPTLLAVRNIGTRGVRVVDPVVVFSRTPQHGQCEHYDASQDRGLWLGPRRGVMMRTLATPGDHGMQGMYVGVMVANPEDEHCPARVVWSSNTLGDPAQ